MAQFLSSQTKRSSRKLNRRNFDEAGATLVEATLVMPLLLLCLITSFELLRVAYNAISIQFVAERVMRQYIVSPMSPSALTTLVVSTGSSLGLKIDPANVTLCRSTTATCSTVETTNRGDVVALNIQLPTVAQSWAPSRLAVSARNFQLTATVVGKNEP